MLVRRVIDDEIDEDSDPALFRRVGELNEIAQCAVARIDIVIIRHVIAVVFAGRRLERHQPHSRHPEPVQIIKPPHQAFEIPHPIPVRVHVRADGEAIDDRVFVPKIVDHYAAKCNSAEPVSQSAPFLATGHFS